MLLFAGCPFDFLNVLPAADNYKKVSLFNNVYAAGRRVHFTACLLYGYDVYAVSSPEIEIDKIWMRVIGADNLQIARAFALEFELIVNPVYPMPHLKQVLRELKNRRIIVGIISNAQFFTPYLFDWFLKSDPRNPDFEPNLTLFSYQFGYAKPSVFLFEVASSRLKQVNIPTDSVLYLGNDMLNDIWPAKKTGFMTGLFAGDARSLRLRCDEPVCKNLSADIVITDLIQLLDYVNYVDW